MSADGRYSKVVRLLTAQDPGFTSFIKPSPYQYVGFSGIPVPGTSGLCSRPQAVAPPLTQTSTQRICRASLSCAIPRDCT